jgi:hypothetical protein
VSESRLRLAMRELEDANREQERCRLEWLIARAAHPSAIDPFAAEAYCIAANEAAESQTRYVDARTEAQSEYLHGEMERTA